jgi:hypothetical protein
VERNLFDARGVKTRNKQAGGEVWLSVQEAAMGRITRPILFALVVLLAIAAASLATVSAAAAGAVTVSFADASRFTDVGSTPWERESNLRALAGHLDFLARRYLADGETLKVEVLDVDLAGTTHPSRRAGRELRDLKGGADAPHIRLRYTLEAKGRPPRHGEEVLSDLAYSQRFSGAHGAEPLHCEKEMLSDWFKARFALRETEGG